LNQVSGEKDNSIFLLFILQTKIVLANQIGARTREGFAGALEARLRAENLLKTPTPLPGVTLPIALAAFFSRLARVR